MDAEIYLKKKSVNHKIFSYSGIPVSYKDVVKYAEGVDPEDNCKLIITKDSAGNLYGFFLRGMMKIDFKKVNEMAGERLQIVSKPELREATGFEPGAVCPFLLKNVKIYVDKEVFTRKEIHFGSGDLKKGILIKSDNLKKLMDFEVKEFSLK